MSSTPNIELFVPVLPVATMRNGWEQPIFRAMGRDGKEYFRGAYVSGWMWNIDGTYRDGHNDEHHSGKEDSMDIISLTTDTATINF